MSPEILTNTINQRLDRLKDEINSIHPGGGLEGLRKFLVTMQLKIQAFIEFIDQLNGEKC